LEHDSVCLINAKAIGTDILKSLILSYLCFPTRLLLGGQYFTPAPIGQLLQVALEHASVCLINATAIGTDILKSLILSYLCFFPLLASYWLGNIYPRSHWSIIAGCPGAR
jgi:hypothetical protein